jgi:hypothetical protein
MENISLILAIVSILLFVVGLLMLVVQAIRKKKKKASLIVILLSIVLFAGSFGLFAMSDTTGAAANETTEQLTRDTLETKAKANIIAHCIMRYDCKNVQVFASTVEISEKSGIVKGKVTLTDDYGDKYQAKFDYTVEIDENGEISDSDLSMETPRKTN